MESILLSGNEAISRGAWEAGCAVGLGYPGTPSTETLEDFARLEGAYAEWAPNEKVALESAAGVSMGGLRCLVTMKHVGVNVAADPLLSLAYTGVGGGLVLLAADDPGIYSSQNEQDSRNYAAFARVPMLEPADSAEAYEFAKLAFDISEQFDTLVMIRSTVRISHTKCPVSLTGQRKEADPVPYVKDMRKWVMMPANAKARRKVVDERTERLREYAETAPINVEELRDTKIGIVCAGAAYQHVREAMPQASIFKLGMSWPLPKERLERFASKVDRLYVVEEACDFTKEHVKALGIEVCEPQNPLPPDDELTPVKIAEAFGMHVPRHHMPQDDLPPRPPALCAGCPHRLVYAELRRAKAIVTGDIGCYTLGAIAPLSSLDSTVCMGASVSMAHGMRLAQELGGGVDEGRPVVAVIGDSTFAHSGITSLITSTYNACPGVVCILDNRTTAMTGQQGNPVNGITLQNRPSNELDLVRLCREGLGIEDVALVDSQDAKAVRSAIKQAIAAKDTLSVIVFKSPCVLVSRKRDIPFKVDSEKCVQCMQCVNLGCPALGKDAESGKAYIDGGSCVGCGQCIQYCKFDAISRLEV